MKSQKASADLSPSVWWTRQSFQAELNDKRDFEICRLQKKSLKGITKIILLYQNKTIFVGNHQKTLVFINFRGRQQDQITKSRHAISDFHGKSCVDTVSAKILKNVSKNLFKRYQKNSVLFYHQKTLSFFKVDSGVPGRGSNHHIRRPRHKSFCSALKNYRKP